MDFTHFNNDGRAKMVNVSHKEKTKRVAKATATVSLNEETYSLIKSGGIKKGDVLTVSQVAGIMAAKNTSMLIPMCHNINITGADIHFNLDDDNFKIIIESEINCLGETGVEMEALTAVTISALTIYDMCKAVQKNIIISDIKLIYKNGGKSGEYKI